MQQMAIEIEQRGAVFLAVDGMVVPEFVVTRLGHVAGASNFWCRLLR